MGEIYRQCTRVRIWLGCKSAECGLRQALRPVNCITNGTAEQRDPFELVRQLAENRHIHDLPFFKKDQQGLMMFAKPSAFEDSWVGFLRIVESAWWTRMWTVQEAILPKAGILTYDTWSLPLDAITTCGSNYYNHAWDCCQEAVSLLPKNVGNALDGFCSVFLTLREDRHAILSKDHYFSIQEQHLSYGSRQCHNPRDKVYGLLAIIGNISDLDLWLTPDYSKSEQEVFYDATVAMLIRDQTSLKCLTGAQYGTALGNWASWVRDFGTTFPHAKAESELNRLMMYDIFDASEGREADFLLYWTLARKGDEEPFQIGLGLTGKYLGTVASVFAMAKSGSELQFVEQRKSAFREWELASGVDFDMLNSDTTRNFWRTMLGGVMSEGKDSTEYSDWRKFNQEAMKWIEPFLSWVRGDKQGMPFALDRTLTMSTEDRCYFKTHQGFGGLCYPTTQANDELWVINGSRVPFILRSAQLNSEEASELHPGDAYAVTNGRYDVKQDFRRTKSIHGYYYLVGDCYLDGHMYGRKDDDKEDDGEEDAIPMCHIVMV